MKAFILVLSFLLVSSTYAQRIKLQLGFEKGHTYSQVQNTKMVMAQNINGQDIITTIEITAKTNFHVKDVRDSVFMIDVSYESLNTKMSNAQMEFELSSSSTKDDPVSGVLRAMINKPFLAVMTRTGRIHEMRIDSLFSSVLNETQAGEQQKKMAAEQLKQYFSEDAAKGSFEMLYAFYPNTSVKLGDTWPVQTSIQAMGALNIAGNYFFKGQTANASLVHGELNIVSDKEKIAEINGMKMNYDLGGTLVTDYELDKNSGWIINGKMTQTLKGTVKIKESAQLPGGMTMQMSMNSETELIGN
jgi:hypothetical protein